MVCAIEAQRYPFRTALVTGGTRGIGRAFVELLGLDGVATVAVARTSGELNGLASAFRTVEPLVADLTTGTGLTTVMRAVTEIRPALVVNNVGFGFHGRFSASSSQEIERQLRLNVETTTRLSWAALRSFSPERIGYLLNVSSLSGLQPGPFVSLYAASKAFVATFSQSLRLEEVRNLVHVTALLPGLTDTAAFHESYPRFLFMSPLDVARAGLRGVERNKPIVVPGALNKLVATSSRILPSALVDKAVLRVRSTGRE